MFEKKRQIDELKKKCFDARKKLIKFDLTVKDTEERATKFSCIVMKYLVDHGRLSPWVDGINPEKSYKIVFAGVKYCSEFDSKQPTTFPCRRTTCPMYEKYREYLIACRALETVKKKTR